MGEIHEGDVIRTLNSGLVVSRVSVYSRLEFSANIHRTFQEDSHLSDGVCVVDSDGVGAELLEKWKVSLPYAVPPAAGWSRVVDGTIEVIFAVTARELDDLIGCEL